MEAAVECKKVKYASQKDAADEIARIRSKSNRSKIPIREYWCKKCGQWHITSQNNFYIEAANEKLKLAEDELVKLRAENKLLKSGYLRNVDIEARKDLLLTEYKNQMMAQRAMNKRLKDANHEYIAHIFTLQKKLNFYEQINNEPNVDKTRLP